MPQHQQQHSHFTNPYDDLEPFEGSILHPSGLRRTLPTYSSTLPLARPRRVQQRSHMRRTDEHEDADRDHIDTGERRYKTIRKVELFHGNFVLDSKVLFKLLDMCTHRTSREFTRMRYSTATCDPNDFASSGFTLWQTYYDPPRRMELFIIMTMYNEDEELFCWTMHGVMKNIAHLCSRERSKTWGKEEGCGLYCE